MSIRKRGSRFVLDFYPEGRKGKRVQRALPAGISEGEATELATMMQVEITLRGGKDVTIVSLFNQYLPWYRMHRSETTVRDIESTYRNHISPILGALHPQFLGPKNIEFYQRTRQLEGASNRTINKELHYFTGFLKWAERHKLMEPRLLRVEQLPAKRPTPIVLSPAEANSLLQALDQPYRAFCTALYTAGLRFSEAAGLTWENVDLAGKVFKVKQKGGSWKVLPVNARLREELEGLPGREGLVFRSLITGEAIRDIRKALKRAAREAGITKHVNPHLFRHSIATALMDRGVNLRVIQGYLGHADLSTTQFYTHVAVESLKAAENAVLSLMGENKNPLQLQGATGDQSPPEEDK